VQGDPGDVIQHTTGWRMDQQQSPHQHHVVQCHPEHALPHRCGRAPIVSVLGALSLHPLQLRADALRPPVTSYKARQGKALQCHALGKQAKH
jgi:hypothetical protein